MHLFLSFSAEPHFSLFLLELLLFTLLLLYSNLIFFIMLQATQIDR